MKKTAIVTGCPGQVATHLVRHLLSLDYKVIGTYRYSSQPFAERFKNYPTDANFIPTSVDIVDPSAVLNLFKEWDPDEVYNLAAAAHVGESFKNPSSVFDINTKAVVNFLEALRLYPNARFIQASTSEMWGSNYSVDGNTRYQDENTPFFGNSPYAVAKIAAHNMVDLYAKSYGLFCCSYIAHNHEGEYRGENYVTMKIIKWVADFKRWLRAHPTEKLSFSANHIHIDNDTFPKLRLGNVHAVRDWSYAGDFAEAAHLILQQEDPKTYVLASGQGRSVDQFLSIAFKHGLGISNYVDYYVVDPAFFRPCEVEFLQGRSNLIKEDLGWEPKVSFNELVERMFNYVNSGR